MMRARTSSSLLLGLLVACGSPEQVFVGELEAPVVYGVDDRLEVFNHPDPDLQRVARESIVALVPTFRINRESDGIYSFTTISLKDERNLCDDEPFGNQPVAASCSGVLLDDDLVLTAGHCISQSRPCTAFNYVFDYYLEGPNQLAPIRDEDVYSCQEVVLELDAPATDLTPDFAIIQLDRPVEGGHQPVTVRPASALDEGDPIAMIGFGSGLPAKIDAGAVVADPRAENLDFFVVNLDAFEGHSGSATFDSNDRLAGILLGGRVPDYVLASGEGCYRANVFDDSEAGEIVHNVAPIIAALCDEGFAGEYLCGPKACEGEPCGMPSVPGEGGSGGSQGVVSGGGNSGCSATAVPPGAGAPWAALLLLWAVRRLRRPDLA
jgi:uncharacterized protein (TIGR03382 family)